MNWKRPAGSGIVSLTGVGLVLVVAREVLGGIESLPGGIIAAATFVLGAAFALAGPVIYRSDVDADHVLRVAEWNTLGVVVTVAVLGLVASFQAATGGDVSAPLLSGAVVVGVSAFAHVLIGFNDVRRIRAQTVAKQRQRAAVVNRFVRHDLRHAAQILLGYGHQLREEGNDLGAKIENVGEDLAETQTRVEVLDDFLNDEVESTTVDVDELIADNHQNWTAGYPEADLETDLQGDLSARAGEHVEMALAELVENACRYGGDPPEITVRGRRAGDIVHIEVLDNGEGIPEEERELINGDGIETQLDHSGGLGLWLTKWIAEQYGGDLSVENTGDGSKATLTLPAAR
jgi:signal transduction histidine kinase